MTPAIALLVIGGILLKSGWKNQNILDVALGRETQRSGGGVPDVSGVTDIPTAPGIPEPAHAKPDLKHSGLANFQGVEVAKWISPILRYARAKGWTGTVTSGYRDPSVIVHASPGLPVAPQGHSNHNFTAYPGGAVDVSHPQELDRILRHSPYAGLLQYAGAKDNVHFSHPHDGGY